MTRSQLFIDAAFLLILSVGVHYSMNVHHQLQMSEQRNNINEDQIQDIMGQLLESLSEDNLELAKNQGHTQGLLTINEPAEKKAYMEIWHAGYYNGIEQEKNHEDLPERLVAE
tara:strand:- start:2081 stop:2419 length:339 start_codon:yes stop_codon:yes gene_type:complete